MRITPQGLPDTSGIGTGTAPVQDTSRIDGPAAVSGAGVSSAQTGTGSTTSPTNTTLQSAVLAPAMDTLAALPEIDHAKVAAIRDALAKGEIRFDAGKLAGLITRYHGPHGGQGGQA